ALGQVQRQGYVGKIRDFLCRYLKHHVDIAGLKSARPVYLHGFPCPATSLQFSCVCGQANFRGAFITFDELDREIEGGFDSPRYVAGTVAWPSATQFDEIGRASCRA